MSPSKGNVESVKKIDWEDNNLNNESWPLISRLFLNGNIHKSFHIFLQFHFYYISISFFQYLDRVIIIGGLSSP